jgi:predicted nucleic acid-binding protein
MSGADVFFDTNVLLYLISPSSVKADRAEELVAAGGTVSVQVLNEFVAVALRKTTLAMTAVREVLSTVRTVCTVAPLDTDTHDLALDLVERYRFSIDDALLVAAALRAKCAVLYSEDLQHGQAIERLTIRNPFAA